MVSYYKSLSQRKRVAFLTVANICLGSLLFILIRADRQREKDYQAYLIDHKCVKEGYAGKYATPVYRCDNGLRLETEIKKEL